MRARRFARSARHRYGLAAVRPVSSFPPEVARDLRAVFCDVDDTLTTAGKLTREAYAAMWALADAGLAVVPVTGRPASWCELMARQWPVAAVVGENGAIAFWERDGVLEHVIHAGVPPDARARLDRLAEVILAAVPGCRVAKDQRGRWFDLAIDYAEEPPRLGLAAAERIAAVFGEHGARARISSIHVNGWFGDFDKLSMVRRMAVERLGIAPERLADLAVFCGDSPNDAPMFSFFPHAVGVANVAAFASVLEAVPAYVTAAPGGAGFAEFARTLLGLRGGGGKGGG